MNFDSNRKRVAETARFDDSFATHMIRDFFFVLVAVVIIELSVRFALVVYDFHHNQQSATQVAAERLASDTWVSSMQPWRRPGGGSPYRVTRSSGSRTS